MLSSHHLMEPFQAAHKGLDPYCEWPIGRKLKVIFQFFLPKPRLLSSPSEFKKERRNQKNFDVRVALESFFLLPPMELEGKRI